jgi:hypothetical protein
MMHIWRLGKLRTFVEGVDKDWAATPATWKNSARRTHVSESANYEKDTDARVDHVRR